MGEKLTLTAEDGQKFSAYKATPAGTPRGALLVVQEIFGVNHHIRNVMDGFAKDGYVSLAPALFDRVEPGFETGYTQDDIEKGRAVRGKLGWDPMVMDVRAAVNELKKTGLKVGVVGYYGGGIADTASEQPRCPVLLHFGETDASIPPEHWERIKKAHPNLPTHVYPGAGHGFSCDERGSFHQASHTLARERTIAFLHKHVG